MISASRGRRAFFLSGEPGEELAVRHLREPLPPALHGRGLGGARHH